jgi:transcriptional regulator with XRE-family HTH domain
MQQSFGSFFSELRRRKAGQSLREFCDQHGFDSGNLSRMERGKLPPPADPEKLARALGLQEGSEDWFRFFDLAAAGRGELPSYVRKEEDTERLVPILFRAYRAGRGPEHLSDKQLADIIRALREK